MLLGLQLHAVAVAIAIDMANRAKLEILASGAFSPALFR